MILLDDIEEVICFAKRNIIPYSLIFDFRSEIPNLMRQVYLFDQMVEDTDAYLARIRKLSITSEDEDKFQPGYYCN